MSWHIGIVGPVATADVRPLLDEPSADLPRGCEGAPLLGTLITELLRLGHRVSAFTLSSDMPLRRDAGRCARGPGFELHYAPMRPRAWPFNGWRPGRIVDLYAFERAGLQRAIAAARPEVLHAHWSYEFAWAALRSGLPHVVTCHDSPFAIAGFYRGFRLAGYRWLRAFIAWHVLRSARSVTTVSPYMVEQVQSMCRVPVQVVPNPLGRDAFGLMRTIEPGRCRVLMVCNGWGLRKNPEPALLAFARVASVVPHAELVLLGTDFGPGETAERWWRARGLGGRVRFEGARPHAEVLAWMSRSELLLHPSLEESFGAVVAEALAIGLPVVAGEASGAVPWIVGEFGRLVDVRSPAAMAEALLMLLPDEGRRQRLGEAARAAMGRRFAVEHVALAYTAAYAEALRARG
jgi:glycosyltransferase involved in cell wall biosynthesis